MSRSSACLLMLAFLPLLLSRAQDVSPSKKDFFLYSIGNSHTWDFRPSADFLEIARAMQMDIKNGWHINCGQNLKTILDKPGQACVDPNEFGLYPDAIENKRWDAITVQTFVGGKASEERAAIDALLDFVSQSINRECDVLIYCTWPRNTAGKLAEFDYAEAWRSDFREDDTLKVLSAQYFDYLERSIEPVAGQVNFIPLGRVLYHFDRLARSGAFPGYTGAGELYRDAWHLNNAGRYIAGLTVFAQVLRIDPEQIPDFDAYHPSDQWPGDRDLTPEQKDLIREIISEVLEF
jgi:hypothetical protein